MTREEALEVFSAVKERSEHFKECGCRFPLWTITERDEEAIDIAIEALDERKVELFDDGTLVVNVKEGAKVSRVLIDGDDHFGGLYYADYGEREEE